MMLYANATPFKTEAFVVLWRYMRIFVTMRKRHKTAYKFHRAFGRKEKKKILKLTACTAIRAYAGDAGVCDSPAKSN